MLRIFQFGKRILGVWCVHTVVVVPRGGWNLLFYNILSVYSRVQHDRGEQAVTKFDARSGDF